VICSFWPCDNNNDITSNLKCTLDYNNIAKVNCILIHHVYESIHICISFFLYSITNYSINILRILKKDSQLYGTKTNNNNNNNQYMNTGILCFSYIIY